MFQPRLGTAPSLGSVANVASYLSPYHHFNFFLIFPVTLRVLTTSPSATLRLSCTAILHPILLLLPVLDRLPTWTRFHSRRPPPPVSAIAVFPLSTFSPGPCRPLQPRALVPRGVVPPVPVLLSSPSVLPRHPLLCRPVSWFILLVCRLQGALLRADERPGRLHSLVVARPSPFHCATRPCCRRSGRPSPPPSSPMVSSLSHPRKSFWSAALERNGES